MKRRQPIYLTNFESPSYTRTRFGRWKWTVRDGMTGPVLATGHTLTERGARRAIERIAERCVCVAGVCRCDRPVLRPLGRMAAYALTERLQRDDVPVTVRVDGPEGAPVVLWPALALTPRQEAHTLRLVLDRTDAPVRWAGVA
ncbi:hypothetical protein OHA21_43660 [Actinoplanes sp. NBC_00393]|uniref:hypothetical protein n=1 Tax=Actinoplanes sp. NBC_00393 TaxID=2975953 RepID=UPI002E1D097B